MWTYKDALNYELLESRIKRTGLVSEWKAFYNLASKYLGMPDLGSGLMVHGSLRLVVSRSFADAKEHGERRLMVEG